MNDEEKIGTLIDHPEPEINFEEKSTTFVIKYFRCFVTFQCYIGILSQKVHLKG